MTDRIWILGAPDPEMAAIESLLRECGERVEYALDEHGERVTPGTAYRCPVPEVPAGSTVYAVECVDVLPEGWVRIDHHRPGDPGYGRPPAEFLSASSVGQVIAELARLWCLRRRWTGTQYLGVRWDGHVEDGIGEHLEDGDIVFGRWGYHTDGVDGLPYGTAPDAEGPDWVVGSWSGNYRGVVIPDDLVYTAAADHCLGAAYRGECPGVDPDALMHWRVAQRATFQGRDAGPEGYLWQEESAVPHGEWYSVHPYLERRDALCTYRHIITSERVQRVIARYYSRPSELAPEGHDICLYCGADNGPHGELRVGWDCHFCGSN